MLYSYLRACGVERLTGGTIEAGGTIDSFVLPVGALDVRVIPVRPGEEGFVTLTNGRRRLRPPSGWYVDFYFSWDHLSESGYQEVMRLIRAAHTSADGDEWTVYHYVPGYLGGTTDRSAAEGVRVLPVLPSEAIRMAYDDRILTRSMSLQLVSIAPARVKPAWLDN